MFFVIIVHCCNHLVKMFDHSFSYLSGLCLYAVDYYVTGIVTVSPISDEVFIERNTTTITCEAFGYPPPTVWWGRINGVLSDRVLVSDSVSVPTGYGNVTRVSVNLTIINASREDTGVYVCSANNSVGNDIINTSITVQCKFVMYLFHLSLKTMCKFFTI